MTYKKTLLLFILTLFLIAHINILTASDGINAFKRDWRTISSSDTSIILPYTIWDSRVLPDFNNNEKNEILLACDNDLQGQGCILIVIEAIADNDYDIIWQYNIDEVLWSHVIFNTTTEQDLDNDGNPEIIAGCDQIEGNGPALYIFEYDSTIPDSLKIYDYPFSTDAPTATYDVNNNGGSISCVFAAQLDEDENIELVIGETHGDSIYVIEINDSLHSSLFDIEHLDSLYHIEYSDSLTAGPWGYFYGDINNDNIIEFGIGNSYYNKIRIYENSGEDEYTRHKDIQVDDDIDGYCLRGLTAQDINEDGNSEIIYVRHDVPGKVFIITPGHKEINEIDSTDIHQIFVAPDSSRLNGVAFGNMDFCASNDDADLAYGNDIYFVSYDGNYVMDLEYIGPTGDASDINSVTDTSNWVAYKIYDPKNKQKMQHLCVDDFDNDGKGEIVIVYSGNSDEYYTEILEHDYFSDIRQQPWQVTTPQEYTLYTNYPNPFNNSTKINYYIPSDKKVTLKIYNTLGMEVKTLLYEEMKFTGNHSIEWNGTSNMGNIVASGIYFYRLEIDNIRLTERMTLLK